MRMTSHKTLLKQMLSEASDYEKSMIYHIMYIRYICRGN